MSDWLLWWFLRNSLLLHWLGTWFPEFFKTLVPALIAFGGVWLTQRNATSSLRDSWKRDEAVRVAERNYQDQVREKEYLHQLEQKKNFWLHEYFLEKITSIYEAAEEELDRLLEIKIFKEKYDSIQQDKSIEDEVKTDILNDLASDIAELHKNPIRVIPLIKQASFIAPNSVHPYIDALRDAWVDVSSSEDQVSKFLHVEYELGRIAARTRRALLENKASEYTYLEEYSISPEELIRQRERDVKKILKDSQYHRSSN